MLIGAFIIFITILIDQFTKQLAHALIYDPSVTVQPTIVVINRVLEFSYATNTGASFNLFSGERVLFLVVTLIALGVFGYLFIDSDFKDKKVYSIAISMFIGGTLGNAIDRLFYGHVIDFLHFPFLDPILGLFNLNNFYNNFADLFLSAAIVLFAIDLFIIDPKRKKKEKLHVEQDIQS